MASNRICKQSVQFSEFYYFQSYAAITTNFRTLSSPQKDTYTQLQCKFDHCNVRRKDVHNFTQIFAVSACVVCSLFGPYSFPDCKSLMRIGYRPDSSFNFSIVFFKVLYNKYLLSKIINIIEMIV